MTAEQVVVLKEAAEDLAQGIDFYESKKQELGTYFLDSLIADLESLKISAGKRRRWIGLPFWFPYG